MTRLLFAAAAAAALGSASRLPADGADDAAIRVYEMRTYYAAPGKLDALQARFRDHTTKLFTKHGITNVGYFVPAGDNPGLKLVYFLGYPSKEARDASWKAFLADPAWQAAKTASEKDGRLVAKVEEQFLAPTDYSPPLKLGAGPGPRVFELRTYTTPAGGLPAINARFRDHTVQLFSKHGITNVIYWNPLPGQKDADVTLVYLLAHNSREAAKASFAAFGKDPEWTAARVASEKKAGGWLTVPNGVKSEFLLPTDYSPLR